MRVLKYAFLLFLPLLFLAACTVEPQNESTPGQAEQTPERAGQKEQASEPVTQTGESPESVEQEAGGDGWRIRIVNTADEEIWSFSESEIGSMAVGQAEAFVHVYSTINNWPTASFFAADGYSIESLLRIAGVFDSAQTITFRAGDGYEISLTRDQLLSAQYYYPHVGENENGAEPVLPIIAYRLREGSSDLSELREENPTLIFGQRNPFEHTNPAFVEGVTEIVVDESLCESWDLASTFPAPGDIAEGETVKLQHVSYGLVKLHYTLDGSNPTPLSKMYNPSTYQPELNVPIPITEPVTIKVLVTGFGKNDSDIAEFEFYPVS